MPLSTKASRPKEKKVPTKPELVQQLEDLGVEASEKELKDELLDKLAKAQTKSKDEKELIELPEKRVESKYPEEQKAIDKGYELVEANLDKTKTWLIQEVQKLGVPTSYIAKMLGVHYSFVHTVISSHGMDVVQKRTQSDEMREMFEAGLAVSEVSKVLNAHYSYVHGVFKRWKEKMEKESA